MRFFVFNDNKPYQKVDMFKIVQRRVPNWYFVVVVAQDKEQELEQHTAGTKFKFTVTIFKFSSISFFFRMFCSLPVVGVVENQYYYL